MYFCTKCTIHILFHYNSKFGIFVAELHRFGGGLAESEGKSPTTPSESKQQVSAPPKPAADAAIGVVTIIPHTDNSYLSAAVPSQKLSNVMIQKTGQRPHLKWKGPDKISKIYGDWIDDL